MLRARVPASSWVLASLVIACDPGMAEDNDDDDMPAARDCSVETRADAYALGMRKAGEVLQVAILEATPAPPSRGDNVWRIRVEDAAGDPQAAEVEVTPFMPDHQHGSSIVAKVEPTDAPGEFTITPVNLFMPGLWEVTMDLALDDGTDDSVVFRFCVDP